MNKKILIYVIVAILAICAGVLAVKNTVKDEKIIETSKNYNNIENGNKIVEDTNTVENKIENEVTNKSENEEEINAEQEHTKTNPEEKEDANKESNEEKAIDVAKKEWGTDNSVYFEFDHVDSKGNYVISVRQKSTTKALAWMTIDIENSKVID